MAKNEKITRTCAEVLENLAATYEQLYLNPGAEGERLYPGVARGGQRAAVDDPFALAIALETMKDALWDRD